MSVNKVIELYLSGKSIPMVSDETGIARSTVRNWLANHEVLRTRGNALRMASKEGRLGTGRLGVKRVFTEEHKNKIRAAKLAHGATFAAGKSLKPSGYFEITRGKHKGRGEHRVIMEGKLGRKLAHDEIVHHVDGDKTNNTPSNLVVMSASQHASHHATERNESRQRNNLGRYI